MTVRATLQYLEWWDQCSQLRGIDTSAVAHLDTWLLDAKLRQVEQRMLYVPVGQWGGHLGQRVAVNMLTGWRGMRALFYEQIALAPEQFDAVPLALPAEWEELQTEFAYSTASGQR